MERTTDPPNNHITLRIPPSPASVGDVLSGVRAVCSAAKIRPDEAETLVVELFANVCKHAAGQGRTPVTIDLDVTDCGLRGAVHDRDPRIPPVPAAVAPGAEGPGAVGDWSKYDENHGWGLGLVASLCAGGRFEFVAEQGGKAAEFCLPAAPADQKAGPGADIPICPTCEHQAGCGCDCCPYPLPAAAGATTANESRTHARTIVDLGNDPIVAGPCSAPITYLAAATAMPATADPRERTNNR